MGSNYCIFVQSELIRLRLAKACSSFSPEILLYDTSDDSIAAVTDSMQYAIVAGEKVDEFCIKLKDKGITVLQYGPAGCGYGYDQLLLSSFMKSRDAVDVVTGIFRKHSLRFAKIHSSVPGLLPVIVRI